jgi:hypothetical protein
MVSPSSRTALDALHHLPLAEAIRSSAWAFPLLEIIHIAAFAAMIGTVLTVELRTLGVQRALPLRELGRLGVKIALVAFAVIVTSGSLLLLSDLQGYLANRAFTVKLGLITLAAINMVVFHLRDSLARPDAIARVQAIVSLVLWLGVISAGRLIAYI